MGHCVWDITLSMTADLVSSGWWPSYQDDTAAIPAAAPPCSAFVCILLSWKHIRLTWQGFRQNTSSQVRAGISLSIRKTWLAVQTETKLSHEKNGVQSVLSNWQHLAAGLCKLFPASRCCIDNLPLHVLLS